MYTLCYEVSSQQWVKHRFHTIHLLDDKGFSKSNSELQGCHEVIILQTAGIKRLLLRHILIILYYSILDGPSSEKKKQWHHDDIIYQLKAQ